MNENKIEILSVDLLDQHRLVVNDLRDLAIKVREDFGWHYLLDLVWIIDQLPVKRNAKILDAGAGVGIMQWYLAEKNVDVFSVDRGSRAKLNMKFRSRYKVSGLREDDLLPHISAIKENLISASDLPNLTRRVGRNLVSLFRLFLPADGGGDVILYNQDLKSLLDIEDNSMDAVVAVSALEHNSPDDLRLVVNELFRVLKPGGKLVATLGAGEKEDWFHEPSKGWNYTAHTLRDIFQLGADAPHNYGDHDKLLQALKENEELKDGLAAFYKTSGDNGMPYGKWDPQYIPVGVVKVKEAVN